MLCLRGRTTRRSREPGALAHPARWPQAYSRRVPEDAGNDQQSSTGGSGGGWFRPRRLRRHDPLAGLSAQERRILELIGEGLTNRQIGERMVLAEKTVKNYVSALFAKLGMHDMSLFTLATPAAVLTG